MRIELVIIHKNRSHEIRPRNAINLIKEVGPKGQNTKKENSDDSRRKPCNESFSFEFFWCPKCSKETDYPDNRRNEHNDSKTSINENLEQVCDIISVDIEDVHEEHRLIWIEYDIRQKAPEKNGRYKKYRPK